MVLQLKLLAAVRFTKVCRRRKKDTRMFVTSWCPERARLVSWTLSPSLWIPRSIRT